MQLITVTILLLMHGNPTATVFTYIYMKLTHYQTCQRIS